MQINNVLLHMIYLLGLACFFKKKYLYEVKLCFNASIEAQVKRLNQKFTNPSKMLTSV